ncbi:MAG: Phytoene/squalene synthetase [Micavibrio sp.]|nr:Phytoene/squalene synthetase [Micavibrio sp.]
MTDDVKKSEECQRLVRTHDPDRFLISLYFPSEIRPYLWALYAFNYEIAKTREIVTDTTIGLIRLQWWRDAIEGMYERNAVLEHDVVEGMAEAMWRFNLPREFLDHMIYAREFDLEDRSAGSLEGLCNYADFTHTPLLRLSAMVVGENPDHPALQPVAMAYALTGLLRARPFHQAQGWDLIPEGMPVSAIREKAADLLRQSASRDEGKLVRLHRVISEQYLNKIKRLGDNVTDARLGVPPVFRPFKLWAAARGK